MKTNKSARIPVTEETKIMLKKYTINHNFRDYEEAVKYLLKEKK